ncbi:MAG: ImmA/IrrE family metallo-endopeptidase [Limisphaerales bacterium]
MTSVVHDVVRRAVSALREEMPESARIRELEVRIRALKDKDRQKARTAILAGLGGHLADWQERWAELNRRLSERLRVAESALKGWFFPADTDDLCVAGHCEAAVMFGSASPNLTESDVLEIATRVFQSTESGSSEKWHASVVDPEPWTGGKEVWRDGYRLAKEWTDHSGIEVNSSGGVDVDQHLRDLGVHVEDISLDDRGIAGIAVMPATGVPRVFLNPRNIQCSYPTGRRFVLAHELCHLLHDRERGADLAMISGPWAPLELEKRANAFAAALLIQDSTLGQTEVARNGRATLVELVSLARRLQVSPNALAHHLGNLGYIDHSNRDELLSELAASLMDREQSTKNPR